MSQDEGTKAAMQAAFEKVQAIKRAHESELMTKANVVGVGVGLRQRAGTRSKEIALVVMVSKKYSPAQLPPDDVIPSEIEGVLVDVQEVGKIQAQH